MNGFDLIEVLGNAYYAPTALVWPLYVAGDGQLDDVFLAENLESGQLGIILTRHNRPCAPEDGSLVPSTGRNGSGPARPRGAMSRPGGRHWWDRLVEER